MATKIISSAERIIFSGHARTKEECETISLACEELAKSEKFRTVKYESGYAEFEKVGVARELKFVAGPASFSILDSVSKEEVIYVSSDGSLDLSFSGVVLTMTDSSSGGFAYSVDRTNPAFVESVSQSSDGRITTVIMKYNIEALSASSSGYNQKMITFESAPRVSIDLTTLSGWSNVTDGSHSVAIKAKADGYQVSPASAGVTFTKQSQHTLTFEDLDGLTVNGSSVSSGYILQNGDVIKALKYGVSGDTPIDGSYVAHIDVSATPDTNITGSNGSYVVQNADIYIAGWLEEQPEGDTSEVTSQIIYKT